MPGSKNKMSIESITFDELDEIYEQNEDRMILERSE